MKNKKWKVAGALVGFFIIVLLLMILVPRKYAVPPMVELQGMQYWDLSTGSHIAYVWKKGRGTPPKYPVIFLQGGPGGFISGKNISFLEPLTDEGYDVYFYDQIGSGHSARLEDITSYTASRHKEDLEAIVKVIGAEKVILIGQSWGAMLATLYVADHPDKVDRLIFTGPGPIIPYRNELAAIPAPDSLHFKIPTYTNREANEEAANLRSRAMEACCRWFGRKLASDEEADAFQTFLNQKLVKSTLAANGLVPRVTGGGGYYVQQMTVNSFGQTPDPRAKLRGCTIPLLIIKGQYDNQKWGFTTEYLELFRHHQLVVIPHAGHALDSSQAPLYLMPIRAFLNQG